MSSFAETAALGYLKTQAIDFVKYPLKFSISANLNKEFNSYKVFNNTLDENIINRKPN